MIIKCQEKLYEVPVYDGEDCEEIIINFIKENKLVDFDIKEFAQDFYDNLMY